MMSGASEMLAAALERMDGIIAGSKAMEYSNSLFGFQSPTSPLVSGLHTLHLLEELRGSLELLDPEEREELRCQVPESTAESLAEWLQGPLENGHLPVGSVEQYQDRLLRLESDRESLVLQVSVLTDQVEVQGEKIRDLDLCLEEHREKLNSTEDLLQQELLSRTALEKQKLELLAEVSSLKLQLTVREKQGWDYEQKSRDSEGLSQELLHLRKRVTEMEREREKCEDKLKFTQDELAALNRQLENSGREGKRPIRGVRSEGTNEEDYAEGRDEGVPAGVFSAPRGQSGVPAQKMGREMESLMAEGEEKDHRIKELLVEIQHCEEQETEPVLQKTAKDDNSDEGCHGYPVTAPTAAPVGVEMEQSAPPNAETTQQPEQLLQASGPVATPKSEDTPKSGDTPKVDQAETSEQATLHSASHRPEAEVPGEVQKGSSQEREEGEITQEHSLLPQPTAPAPAPAPAPQGPAEDSFGTRKVRSSFGRGFFKIRRGKRTASAPNLEREGEGTAPLDLAGAPCPSPSNSAQTLPWKKSLGIRKFFGRLKRSQSTSFALDDEVSGAEFRRGGVRATAGPRLGWARDLQGANNELDAPFARWSREQVCDWLKEQGLGVHVGVARQWITSGLTLLQASQQDLDRELGIKHPLHRKKLQLALQALGSEEEDNQGKLHYGWVTTWLDDIGLPQYKSQFEEGRVDGRMLHHMTVDDLLSLKVVSVLHHLSVKRAIQVLRLNDYQPHCLSRRPSEEADVSPAEVCCWSNHRVMEWLRSVDLAEYAPNLRGSGVHGALMVLEPRFTVETLALLLNISPNKTLLRRHLATHFHLLVGTEAQREKQEHLESPDYAPLTATAKVKPRKLLFGGFGSLRRRRQEEVEEYVCPMDMETPRSCSFPGGRRHLDPRLYEDELDRLQRMEDSEGTVRQIGALSEGINNLTSLLQKDQFLREMAAGSPVASQTEDSSV
ncbi:liprin-beta-1-like isoform X2 [Anguilla rostrata]|uniref:liprin-beta-1-like isoform X2 n=1 Tax=Anguilla rostrata TaxID=7938 RepID=UPI0030D5897F